MDSFATANIKEGMVRDFSAVKLKKKNSQRIRNAFTLLPYLCFCITQQSTAQQANLSHLCLVHMISHAHPPLDT